MVLNPRYPPSGFMNQKNKNKKEQRMNKVIYQDHKYIKTQEDYEKVKLYLEEYIIGLLGQPRI